MTLERIEHKVFASEAPLEEMGQFGSALATTKLNTKDVAEIQALPAYTKGWGSAIISENNYPAMEEMNGVLNVMSYHTGYLYQEGIPTYSATQEYSVTSWVKDLAGEKVYKSLQGGNKGHDLTDPAWWMELKLGGGGGLEIGDIGIAPLGIDETKGKRRYLNGQLIIQDQYVQFTQKLKKAIELYPTLACTESEWQTTATMTVGGQVGKFVVDDEAGTIRLPKIIMPIQGLTDLSKLGKIVEAGLPQHQHYAFVKALGTGTDKGETLEIGTGTACSNTKTGGYNNTKLVSSSKTANAGKTGNALNSIYGKSNTVQPEAIQYPYFIQVATGAETEDNIINEIELNNPFSLLDYKFSEYELNNLSWLRSEGQYNSKAVYPAVYDLLLKIYNGTETKAGVSVKLSTEAFTDYDFVLNTAEETFRLPIKVKIKPLNGNIPVTTSLEINDVFPVASAIKVTTLNGDGVGISGLQITNDGYVIRGDQTLGTNQMPVTFANLVADGNLADTTDLYLYFYVGETVQNANLINAGRIEEKLVDKVDVNSSWGFPSDRYIDLTLGASGTEYTAPANGYVVISKRASANNQSVEINIPSTGLELRCTATTSGGDALTSLVVKRGQIYKVNYNAGGTTNYFRFIYAEGEQ